MRGNRVSYNRHRGLWLIQSYETGLGFHDWGFIGDGEQNSASSEVDRAST
jgi:hypothetical protein